MQREFWNWDLCYYSLCYDGKVMSEGKHYCGVGACNMFGCDCQGGCRGAGNTVDNAAQIFIDRYEFINVFSIEKAFALW